MLRGVSFSANLEVKRLRSLASGAGKSTLLHVLGGLEAADHRKHCCRRFCHRSGRRCDVARFRNQHVGFVFSFIICYRSHRRRKRQPAASHWARVGPSRKRCVAARLLAEVGFDGRSSASLVGHLSGGEQQRVAVCRALVTRPELVLADEPTGNLDTTIGDEISRSLVSYARNNRAIVIIATHNRALAGICDHTLALESGRLSSSNDVHQHLK